MIIIIISVVYSTVCGHSTIVLPVGGWSRGMNPGAARQMCPIGSIIDSVSVFGARLCVNSHCSELFFALPQMLIQCPVMWSYFLFPTSCLFVLFIEKNENLTQLVQTEPETREEGLTCDS